MGSGDFKYKTTESAGYSRRKPQCSQVCKWECAVQRTARIPQITQETISKIYELRKRKNVNNKEAWKNF